MNKNFFDGKTIEVKNTNTKALQKILRDNDVNFNGFAVDMLNDWYEIVNGKIVFCCGGFGLNAQYHYPFVDWLEKGINNFNSMTKHWQQKQEPSYDLIVDIKNVDNIVLYRIIQQDEKTIGKVNFMASNGWVIKSVNDKDLLPKGKSFSY